MDVPTHNKLRSHDRSSKYNRKRSSNSCNSSSNNRNRTLLSSRQRSISSQSFHPMPMNINSSSSLRAIVPITAATRSTRATSTTPSTTSAAAVPTKPSLLLLPAVVSSSSLPGTAHAKPTNSHMSFPFPSSSTMAASSTSMHRSRSSALQLRGKRNETMSLVDVRPQIKRRRLSSLSASPDLVASLLLSLSSAKVDQQSRRPMHKKRPLHSTSIATTATNHHDANAVSDDEDSSFASLGDVQSEQTQPTQRNGSKQSPARTQLKPLLPPIPRSSIPTLKTVNVQRRRRPQPGCPMPFAPLLPFVPSGTIVSRAVRR
mmetsp:Transcript_11019/g.30424  ORF Transcript_11019/g.30424 Transcript_11019/m.30424 type:complete len:316 (-) Transcript_11019:669-1616(-)